MKAPRPSHQRTMVGKPSLLQNPLWNGILQQLRMRPPQTSTKKKKQFDNRLAPVRELIKSQPPAIKSSLSDVAIRLLLGTQKLSYNRAGTLTQRMNEDSFPRPVNIKAKLEFPPALKDYPQTIQKLHQWNDYLDEVKKKLKVGVLAQSDHICEFLHKERSGLFMEKIVAMAKGYGVYHRQLEGAEGAPLSNQAYGAGGVYCYYSRLPAGHEVFQYLGENKATSLAKVRAKYLVTADGSTAFHASQLLELYNFPLTLGQVAATPPRLPPSSPDPCDHPVTAPWPMPRVKTSSSPRRRRKSPTHSRTTHTIMRLSSSPTDTRNRTSKQERNRF
jgi:hypothetical protein